MGRGSDKSGKGGIGRDDFLLWKAFTKDIEPLEDPNWDDSIFFEEAGEKPTLPQRSKTEETKSSVFTKKPAPSDQIPQLDGNTDRRLKRGQIPIDGRLDLHGFTQEQAHGILTNFVQSAYAQNKRCLLVITGKGGGRFAGLFGESRGGVLKQKLPQWLSDYPLKDIVLKAVHAAPKDGGSGAFYLYLKRKREPSIE